MTSTCRCDRENECKRAGDEAYGCPNEPTLYHWRLTIELSGHAGLGLPRLAASIAEGRQARPATAIVRPLQ